MNNTASSTPRSRMRGAARARLLVGTLTLSAAALVGLVVREGYSERAYPDPTYGTRVPTVGFGSTGPDITMDTRLPPVPALQRALRDVNRFEGAVKQCVTVPLFQAEYDVYVHLAYNLGPGKEGVADGFCWAKRGGPSALVRELNAGNYRAACDRILDWRFSNKQDCSAPGNRTCRGLWVRRQAEHSACVAAGDAS